MRVFVVTHLQTVCSLLFVVNEILFVFFVHLFSLSVTAATRSRYFCDMVALESFWCNSLNVSNDNNLN